MISEDSLRLMQIRLATIKMRSMLASSPPAVSSEPEAVESDLHYKIIEECKRRQWIYFHGSMAHRTKRTIAEPDFTILADGGRVFFFEAKRKGGKLSPEQLGLKIWAERLGTIIHTIFSVEEFLAIVDGKD